MLAGRLRARSSRRATRSAQRAQPTAPNRRAPPSTGAPAGTAAPRARASSVSTQDAGDVAALVPAAGGVEARGVAPRLVPALQSSESAKPSTGAAGPAEHPLLDPDRVGGRARGEARALPAEPGEACRSSAASACAATRSRRPRTAAAPPAASRGCRPGPPAPSRAPLSGRASARGVALLLRDREQQRVEADQAVGREGEAHPPVVRRAPAQRARRPTARAPCHSA